MADRVSGARGSPLVNIAGHNHLAVHLLQSR
jgi:hypothetical protein